MNQLPFAPDAMVRRVHREGVILLGGGRALLMQVAHPLVAQGVSEHSSFSYRRIDRLLRTLRPTLAIVFGSREQALDAASSINRVHERVKGAGYSAGDPALLTWVLATLIDSALVMHRRFIGPLAAEDAERYYAEMRFIGELLDIPRGYMPETLSGLEDYMAQMTDTLEVSDAGREIAAQIFRPLPGSGPAMLLMRELTAGLLPAPLRRQFGLTWGPAREAQLRVLASISRAILPHLPLALRGTPALFLPIRPDSSVE